MQTSSRTSRGFTLIELLIVVAIIAILAAIAVPNFLEAQTRAKVSRAKAEMRTLATAIESYRVDTNKLPLAVVDSPFGDAFNRNVFKHTFLASLSTPIAYLTSMPRDPFQGIAQFAFIPDDTRVFFDYRRTFKTNDATTGETVINEIADGASFGINAGIPPESWIVFSPGPDRWMSINTKQTADGAAVGSAQGFGDPVSQWSLYDPTNGTVSIGDLVRAPEGDNDTLPQS